MKTEGRSRNKVLILFLLMSIFSVVNSQAQERITGAVSSANGMPLPGVNVLQKGTGNGTVTDFDGNFSITMRPGSKTLVFSYLGYVTEEITISNQTTISVVLQEDMEALNEVVVIGYAAVDKKKVLGSITGIKAESMEQATPITAFDAVQGKLAGVQIATNNGPGAGFDIQIRGVSTFGAGTQPLYVVDGQQLEDIDNLNPNDIESIEVLKDGATAAIYGSKAANGVVLITTKSGKEGKLSLDVSSITGLSTLVGDLPVSNAAQRTLYERLRSNNPDNPTGGELDSLNLLRRNSYDLQELITRMATRQQINVALSGGDKKTKYYFNTGFLNSEGIVRSSGYRRINTQLRVDVNPTRTLKVGTRINLSYDKQYGVNENNAWRQVTFRVPYYPLFQPDGSYTPTIAGQRNPLADADFRILDNKNYRSQIFTYAELEVLPKLKVKSTLGINFRLFEREFFEPRLLSGNFATGTPRGSERRDRTYDIQQENYLNYRNKWGKHNFAAFGGMQIQKYSRAFSDIYSPTFNNEIIRTFNNAAPGSIIANNFNENHNIYSLFGGFNYDFANKYLIGATIRRDGSSRFGDENEFGYFPSATLGWRVTNENFLKNNALINNLLFRASWGVVGNERIGNYEFTSAFEPGFDYNGMAGIGSTRLGNSELSWEETESVNLGFDLSMFKNRLDINFDLWEKNTTGLLANTPLPEESGFTGIRRNVGAVNNRGIDLNITGTLLKAKDFSWTSNFNIGYLENEVTKLDGGTPFESGAYRIEEGQPIGNIYGYKNLGVFPYDESNAFTPDGVQLTPNFDSTGAFTNYTLNGSDYTGDVEQLRANNQTLRGGDIFWQDLDGNFVIDNNDRQVIGNGLPTTYGGFSHNLRYKNFSVSVLFDYSFGFDIYRVYDEVRNDLNSANETPGPDRITGAWREQGDMTVYPRLTRVVQNRLRPNSFFVTDGSYIKWRYIRFNYDFPKSVLDKMNLFKSASLNLAVNNLMTWTNYEGYNPELGSRGNPLQPNQDFLRYPNNREIILGLKVQF
ncbi:TonB-dependent receptor [Gaetbulibacter sp. M240]|uniref:SusC/RagA family TonB-linked outer membrane protein n=1 Tax=Gaetbulibacter sp. M240 TaxID=3126511 RepID=UPI00374F6660